MTNVNPLLLAYRRRLIEIEEARRVTMEDAKELGQEYRNKGLTSDEIKAVKMSVRRSFENADNKASRSKVEEIADTLDLAADLPSAAADAGPLGSQTAS